MTPKQFRAWREKHFRSRHACAIALGIDREAVAAMESGRTRKGYPYAIPLPVELACAAWAIGLRQYDGGAVTIG